MQPDDLLRARAKEGLEAARRARVAKDDTARVQALTSAWEAARELADGSLVATTSWRLAKARYDLGLVDTTLDALAPLLEHSIEERGLWGVKQRVGPFDHYEAGLRALEPLTRRHWDHHGYGPTLLDPLWEAWFAAQEARGHAFTAAWGRIVRAWSAATTGQLDTVRAVVLSTAQHRPEAFAHDPHAHPRAATAHDSAGWLQVDAARMLLRAATWAASERVAWEAQELLMDAVEDVRLDHRSDPWLLDAMLHAAERFGGWTIEPADVQAYRRLAPHLPSAHRARAAAWLGRHDGGPAAGPAVDAARACAANFVGPEWTVASWLDAHRAGQEGALDHARAEAARTGVVMAGLD